MYTQAPALTGEEVEALLGESLVARLCTHNEDGTIHAAPVWYRYENGRMVLVSIEASRKTRNLQRNPRVTVIVDVERPVEKGVLIYGTAEVSRDGVMPAATAIFERYVPGDQVQPLARGLFRLTRWVKVTITPDRVVSFDYGKDTAFQDAYKG